MQQGAPRGGGRHDDSPDEDDALRAILRPSAIPRSRDRSVSPRSFTRSIRSPAVPSLGEPFVTFPVPRDLVPLATSFRSTWLSSSIRALSERGHYDRYVELLPPLLRAPILESVAGVWLPMGFCIAHYRACEALGLSRRESWDIGVEVTRKVHGTSLALAIRLAKQAGVTPWTIFSQLPRLWDRIWQGGAVGIHKIGPKEAVLEAVGWPVAGIPYVRNTMPAVVHGVVEMFCAKAYVSGVPALATETSVGFRVQWV